MECRRLVFTACMDGERYCTPWTYIYVHGSVFVLRSSNALASFKYLFKSHLFKLRWLCVRVFLFFLFFVVVVVVVVLGGGEGAIL